MAAAGLASPEDQRVTWVELFFDLVFVFCITQVAALFHGHIDASTAGKALLVFWLVWWAWTQFTWALNAANTEHAGVQLATLAATGVAFFLAVGIPRAFGESPLGFAVPYVVVRLIGLAVYLAVAWHDPEQRRAVSVFSLCSLAGLAAVIAGAMLAGPAQYGCWGIAIVLDFAAARVGAQREGWNLHPDHFVERHGLVVIIAIGETLIVAAAGLVNAPLTPSAVITGVMAVALSGALWWSYFRHARHAFEHAMRSCTGLARSSMARDAFSLLHFPMLCGIVAVAAGTEMGLAAPAVPLPAAARVAIGGGSVLFVCGTALAMARASGHAMPWRWVGAIIGALVVILAGGPPALSLGIMAAALLVVGLAEHRQQTTH